MARLFDDASSEYLENANAVLSDYPMTLACWINTNDDTAIQTALCVGSSTHSRANHIVINGSGAGDPILAMTNGSAGQDYAETSTGITANTWHHIAGVFAASDDRAAFIDGGSKGTETTDSTLSNLNRTAIGRYIHSGAGWYFSGHIAEAAIWNVALSDAEVAALADGASPLTIHPQNLVAYWPLIRGLQDWVGGYDMTATGTTVSAHVPDIMGRTPVFTAIPPSAAPAGRTTYNTDAFPLGVNTGMGWRVNTP